MVLADELTDMAPIYSLQSLEMTFVGQYYTIIYYQNTHFLLKICKNKWHFWKKKTTGLDMS